MLVILRDFVLFVIEVLMDISSIFGRKKASGIVYLHSFVVEERIHRDGGRLVVSLIDCPSVFYPKDCIEC